jgi:hypothetical protein
MDLTPATTKELVDELAKREGVTEHTCAPHQPYSIWISIDFEGRSPDTIRETGPARILVVID